MPSPVGDRDESLKRQRRERNRASQIASRQRKADKMESLRLENVALQEQLQHLRRQMVEFGFETRPSSSLSPVAIPPLLERQLQETSLEPRFREALGRKFPAARQQPFDLATSAPPATMGSTIVM